MPAILTRAEIDARVRRLSPEQLAELDALLIGCSPQVPDFSDWLPVVSPSWRWDWPHLAEIRRALADVTSGACKRLMIFCPPRHGKSEQTTIRYPVWRLERDPSTRVVVGCYNQRFAERFGRRSRRLAETRGIVSRDRRAAMEWETYAGGVYRSCGVGSPPTGEGFNLAVLDDVIKSREEAESDAYRERAWEWYSDIYTRLEPGAAVILMMTRWHEDDPAGRLIEEARLGGEAWRVVSMPAITDGRALWPERYPLAALENIKRVLGGYAFEALYQQSPTAKEGNLFKVGMMPIVDAAPAGLRKCRAWDFAATSGGGDHTVGILMGTDDAGRFCVLNVRRGQWGPDEADAEVKQTAALDGRDVPIHGAEDPGSAGKRDAKAFVRMLAGYVVETEKVTGDKTTRARAFASQVNAGNVSILRAPWNHDFIEELRKFPSGKHDDQVDAASDSFNVLAGAPALDYSSGYAYSAPKSPAAVGSGAGSGYAF